MRALVLLAVIGCATTRAPRTIANRGSAPKPTSYGQHGQLGTIERVAPAVLDYDGVAAAASFYANGATSRDRCVRDLYAAWMRGREAMLAHASQIAIGPGPCRAIAEPVVAAFARALYIEESGCTAFVEQLAARAWRVVARLATTAPRRARALRNTAEASWRAAGWRARADEWAEVARRFDDAATAGDADALDIADDAWTNALAAAARMVDGDPARIDPALLATLRHRASAPRHRRLREALTFIGA